jgi:glycogen operon protein
VTKQLIAYRQRRGSASQEPLSLNEMLRLMHVEWHGVELNRPDWEKHSHSLAFTLGGRQDRHRVHVMLNAYWEALQFQLPRSIDGAYGKWRRVLDTSSRSPPGEPPEVTEDWCCVQSRSIMVLVQELNVTL